MVAMIDDDDFDDGYETRGSEPVRVDGLASVSRVRRHCGQSSDQDSGRLEYDL